MADDALFTAGDPADARYSAAEMRHWVKSVSSYQQGVGAPGALLVTQHSGTADKTVSIAAGDAYVIGTEDADQGSYFVHCLAQSLDILTPHPSNGSNPRNDIVGIQIKDKEYSGTVDTGDTNVPPIVSITGTPAGSPVDPTLPNNFLPLARVRVGTGVTTITAANITDIRPYVDKSYVVSLCRARATMTGVPTYTHGVAAVLSLDSESYDYHTDYDASTFTYTAPATADYETGSRVLFGNNNQIQRAVLWVFVNGSSISRLDDNSWQGLSTNSQVSVGGTDQLHIAAGATVTWVFEPLGIGTTNGVQIQEAFAWIRRLN